MSKGDEPHSEMAQARHSDGINVIFDRNSSSSPRSRSRSSCDSNCSSGSGRHRGCGSHRGRYRSSSSSSSSSSSISSSSSRSSSRSRSRSYPRCHRHSSCCRCDGHRGEGRDYRRRSPPRRYRARSRSYSRSPSQDRYSDRRHYRSRSRSSGRRSRYSWGMSRFRRRFSRSPIKANRYRSRSRSSGRSVSLSVNEKREMLKAAKANAMKILGVENLELPKSVKSILSEQSESKWVSTEARVRNDSQKTASQSSEAEPDDTSSPKMSPKRTIAFSANNSVAKPTVAPSSSSRLTPRVDSFESRKPYGHWIPVKPLKTSKPR